MIKANGEVSETNLKGSSRDTDDGETVKLLEQSAVYALELVHLRLHDVVDLARVLRTRDRHPRVT